VARVKFKPPKSSSVPAKAIPFAVRVRSREDARASLVEEGTVEVGAFNDTFAELIPRTAKGSSRARAQLALDNRGNARINARLTAADPDRKLNFAITPQALSAEPGTASFASIRVSPRQRFLTGPPKLNPYKVLVHQDGLPTISVDGSMQQEGLIPPWLIPVAIAALAILLVLAILWFVVLRPSLLSEATRQNAAAVQIANANANQALSKANQALGNKPTTTPTPGAAVIGPNGGPAYSGVLALPDKQSAANPLVIPSGGNLLVTDVVFENPNGGSGVLQWKRKVGNTEVVLINLRLENFRDLDFHFVTPQVFNENDTMTLACSADSGSSCKDSSVYFSGFFKNPPPG